MAKRAIAIYIQVLGLLCLFVLADAALFAIPAATLLAEAARLLLAALCGLLPTDGVALGWAVTLAVFPVETALATACRPALEGGEAVAGSGMLG